MSQTDQLPLPLHLFKASQEEIPKPEARFDLAEHRFDDHLPTRVLRTPLLRPVPASRLFGVEHLNKRAGGSAIHRTQGSIGIIGATRAAWLVAKHRQEPESRLFLPIKNNLGNDQSGLSFKLIKQAGAMPACLTWSNDPVTTPADELLNQSAGYRKIGAVDIAEAWLVDLLSDGSLAANDVWEAAKAEGLSRDTVKKAKSRLGIKSRQAGVEGGWTWHLHEGEEKRSRQDPAGHRRSCSKSGAECGAVPCRMWANWGECRSGVKRRNPCFYRGKRFCAVWCEIREWAIQDSNL